MDETGKRIALEHDLPLYFDGFFWTHFMAAKAAYTGLVIDRYMTAFPLEFQGLCRAYLDAFATEDTGAFQEDRFLAEGIPEAFHEPG